MSSVPPSDQQTTEWHDPRSAPGWAPGGRLQPPPVGAEYAHGAWAPTAPPERPTWNQPGPGYAEPGYASAGDPAYPAPTAWGTGPEARYRRPPRIRRSGPSWATVAPGLFASLVIGIGIVVLFVGNLFVALGAPAGTSGRDRLLQFLAPADLAAAAALVLAVALVGWQRSRSEVAPAAGGGRFRTVALVAGGVAALVALAALIRGIVLLTVPHTPGAVKVGDLIAELAVVLVAGAAAAWSLRTRW